VRVVCARERACVRERERECVCVCARARASVRACVCVCVCAMRTHLQGRQSVCATRELRDALRKACPHHKNKG